MQQIPDSFNRGDLTVKLFVAASGDTAVQQIRDGKAFLTSRFTFEPHGIELYHGLRKANGLPCESYTSAPSIPKVVAVKECADEDHDWEWVDPDDDNSRAIVCSKCKATGEAEDD